MKDKLKALTREELQELGQKYLPDYSTKLNNLALISKLASRQLDQEDISWINQAYQGTMLDKANEEAEAKQTSKTTSDDTSVKIAKVLTNYLDEETGRPLTSKELEAKQKHNQQVSWAEQVAKAKRAANETVIAYVTPLSKEDLSMQKTCEAFITGNAYFSVSAVVPFNVYVEIPKAIAKIIRETTCPQITELSDFQRNQLPYKPIASIQNIRKYNIQVYTHEQFEAMRKTLA